MGHDYQDYRGFQNCTFDDRAAAELDAERRERTLSALYSAAMLGLAEEDLRWLIDAAGLTYADLQQYTPPIIRQPHQSQENA